MKQRPPQLTLRLDFDESAPEQPWCDGGRVPYLGGRIALRLDTLSRDASFEQGVLYLPLPPEATARQIQDRAETWLREEAERILQACVQRQAKRLDRPAPVCTLSFASRANWVQVDAKGHLRCNWRLIEQPMPVIEQVIGRAVAELPRAPGDGDLFACPA